MVQSARKKAIKTVNETFTHPGFRRGKAPESVVIEKFGSRVEQEFQSKLADEAYLEARKLAKVPVLNNNSKIIFNLKSASLDAAELEFTFETEPTIPAVDPKLFVPKAVTRPPVEEKQINEAIHQMRFYFADWEEVKDRGIQEGDYILINMDTAQGKVFDHIRFEVSSERMAGWMKALVLGAKTGDILKGTSVPDEDASDEEKKNFEPKDVTVTILKVEFAKLPEINDDFAKKVGAENVEAMKKSVTDLLSKRADDKVQDELRDQVNDFMIDSYTFDVPQSLVDTEKKHRLDQLLSKPTSKKDWESKNEEEKKQVEVKYETEANQAVRLFYLSRKIIRDAKISITQEEVHSEIKTALGPQAVRSMDSIPKEYFAVALSNIMVRKAQDYVIQEQKQA